MHPSRPGISWRRVTEKVICREHEQWNSAQCAKRMHLRLTRHKINTLLVLGRIAPLRGPKAAELGECVWLTRECRRDQWTDTLELIFVHRIDEH